ncbi:hypothetical protein [Variovorax sp. GT1P44]|uniref:hypothetical protein n=1 Tax=Variovorax sp. GT1P44 TaxID=3443742 RepID=UPI003F471A84
MATAALFPWCQHASRSYRVGAYRLRFFDLGPWRAYQHLSPRLGIRQFATAWTPHEPTPDEREEMVPAISRAAHHALSQFDRQLGRPNSEPMLLLGDM